MVSLTPSQILKVHSVCRKKSEPLHSYDYPCSTIHSLAHVKTALARAIHVKGIMLYLCERLILDPLPLCRQFVGLESSVGPWPQPSMELKCSLD